MEQLIIKLHSYLKQPEVVKLLFCRQQADGTNPDRHSRHVSDGYKIISQYKYGQDTKCLDEAVRYFDRVVDTDMKYLQALALYGKVIAYGMVGKFNNANENIAKLKNFKTTGFTDYWQEIDDVRHYASNEILKDLREAFVRLHPNGNWNGDGCATVILLLVALSSALCLL